MCIRDSGGGGSASSVEGRFPDISAEPVVLWSTPTHEMLGEMVDSWVDNVPDGFSLEQYLAESGWLQLFEMDDGAVVVRPAMHEWTSSRFYAYDVRSGSQRWSGTAIPEGAQASCVPTGSALTCLESSYRDSARLPWVNALHTVAGADGSVRASTDLPASEEMPTLSSLDGDILVATPDVGLIQVSRLSGRDHTERWSIDVGGDSLSEVSVSERGAALNVTHEGGSSQHLLVDPSTGEAVDLPAAQREGLHSAYAWYGDLLLGQQVPGFGEPGAATVQRFAADGEQLWSVRTDGGFARPQHVEPGAPVLTVTAAASPTIVTALHPVDGRELWTYVGRESYAHLVFATPDEVGVVDGERLVVLEATSGVERWSERSALDSVRISPQHLYGVERDGTVKAFRLSDGSTAWSLPPEDGLNEGYTRLVDIHGTVFVVRGDRLTAIG